MAGPVSLALLAAAMSPFMPYGFHADRALGLLASSASGGAAAGLVYHFFGQRVLHRFTAGWVLAGIGSVYAFSFVAYAVSLRLGGLPVDSTPGTWLLLLAVMGAGLGLVLRLYPRAAT
jgi:hypothetical protein